MQHLAASELILNEDGSIYHLNLLPEQLAHTIILVGDPERVERITKHFDEIEVVVRKREFHTQTGWYKGKRLSVVSTGIGTDNIDIVLNELDALVNIDLQKRKVKRELTSLNFIRVGTSGAIQPDIPVDHFLLSKEAVGFDALLHFYQSSQILDSELADDLFEHLGWDHFRSRPYAVRCGEKLYSRFASDIMKEGITGTNIGFYAPQGRSLRLALQDASFQDKLRTFEFQGKRITNLEMETSAIYGLAGLLGHQAISLNAIIANRATGNFSADPVKLVDQLIEYALERV